MVQINVQACTGCGACVPDCILHSIEVVNGKAQVVNPSCIGCGHCLAICPANAVSLTQYAAEESIPYDPATCDIAPDHLMRFFKTRRSVRQFEQRELSDQHVQMLLDAGRHMPTGSNLQGVRYILTSMETTKKIVQLTNDFYADFVASPAFSAEKYPYTAWSGKMLSALQLWRDVYRQQGEDRAFRTAPQLLFAVCDYANWPGQNYDAMIALSAIELMAHSLGIGAVYVGVATPGVEMNPKARELLRLKDGDFITMTLGLGYPKPELQYHRSAPRNPASWYKV